MKTLKDKILESNEQNEVHHYVDGILVSPDDEILVLQRAGYMKQFPGKWGFVGGSVDKKDKSSKDAIIREVKEETGIELTVNEQHKMEKFDTRKHLGGSNDDIVVSDTEYWIIPLETKPEVKISREHSRYKWMTEENFKEKQGKYVSDVFHYIQLYYDR